MRQVNEELQDIGVDFSCLRPKGPVDRQGSGKEARGQRVRWHAKERGGGATGVGRRELRALEAGS